MYVCLADNQDITRAGLLYILSDFADTEVCRATDKTEMIEQLKEHPDAVVVLDYTIFDINDADEIDDIGA